MKKIKHWIIAGLIIPLIVWTCRVVSDDEGGDQGVDNFVLEVNEIGGWTQSSIFEFDVNNCHLDAGLDGGAEKYIDEGLIRGFRQIMKSTEFEADIFVMDFGDDSKATNMFNRMSADYKNNKMPIDGYAATVVVTEENLSGVNTIAHFGRFFIEIKFTGYLNKAESRATAKSFIETLEKKYNDMK